MPLVDFVWDTELSESNGEFGIAGTAKDPATGKIIDVFVTEGFLKELNDRQTNNPPAPLPDAAN